MWESVQNGLLRGITSVSLEWGAEALGLSPLIGSLTSAAIAGGIEALLMGQNPIQGIFDTYFRAGTGTLTLGGDGGNNPWLRAAYLSQVLDFSQIVQERGIVNALETYAAGFLHQQTINEIWKQGGIADLLAKPQQIEITTNAKGETVKRIYTMDINSAADKLTSNYIDLSPTYDMLMGYREGNIITHCEFVIGPDGRPQLKNGEREILNPDGSKRVETVENFNLTKMDYVDASGNKIGYYVPATGTGSIIVGADGKVTSGKFVSLVTDYNVSTKDNQVTDFGLKRDYVFSETQRTSLLNSGITEQDLYGFKEVVSFANGMLQYFVLPPDTPLFNIDEGAGRAWLDSLEADGRAFWQGVGDLARGYVVGDTLPQLSYADGTYANIDLNLMYPENTFESMLNAVYALSGNYYGVANGIENIGSFLSRWQYTTEFAAEMRASLFDQGYKFVYNGGMNSGGLTPDKLQLFYGLLDTDKTVSVGFSAGTVDSIKSWGVSGSAQADYYILISTQASPLDADQLREAAGIAGDRLLIIDIAGDLPKRWTGSFADNIDPATGEKRWDYIRLDVGGDLGSNPFVNHGEAVRGILENRIYEQITVNGQTKTNASLLEEIKKKMNGEE